MGTTVISNTTNTTPNSRIEDYVHDFDIGIVDYGMQFRLHQFFSRNLSWYDELAAELSSSWKEGRSNP
jgi:hypothetical protein